MDCSKFKEGQIHYTNIAGIGLTNVSFQMFQIHTGAFFCNFIIIPFLQLFSHFPLIYFFNTIAGS
jgi:hypothetical protein